MTSSLYSTFCKSTVHWNPWQTPRRICNPARLGVDGLTSTSPASEAKHSKVNCQDDSSGMLIFASLFGKIPVQITAFRNFSFANTSFLLPIHGLPVMRQAGKGVNGITSEKVSTSTKKDGCIIDWKCHLKWCESDSGSRSVSTLSSSHSSKCQTPKKNPKNISLEPL